MRRWRNLNQTLVRASRASAKKKIKKNSYEEKRKLVEDGDEMQLKETIKTKQDDNNKKDNKIKFDLFD